MSKPTYAIYNERGVLLTTDTKLTPYIGRGETVRVATTIIALMGQWTSAKTRLTIKQLA